MPTTTEHGIPIPEETDKLGETDERIVELAEWLDDHTFRPKVYPNFEAVTDLITITAPSSGYFNVNDAQLAVQGLLVQLHLELVYTGPSFNPPADGVFGPALRVFAGIGDPSWRPLFDTGGHSDLSARLASFVLDASGSIYCTAVGNVATLDAGDLFNATFTYIRAGD